MQGESEREDAGERGRDKYLNACWPWQVEQLLLLQVQQEIPFATIFFFFG